jgi:SAM-dependent methyltransferase
VRATRDGHVICGGEDEEFADEASRDAQLKGKARTLEKKLAMLLPKVEPRAEFAWTASFGQSKTGLPSIGPIPGHARCYAVLGYGGNGITFSMLAAQLVSASIGGRPDPDAELFALSIMINCSIRKHDVLPFCPPQVADVFPIFLASASASADFVWSEYAWCYVADKPKLIAEAARIVCPGGVIAFTDWVEGARGLTDSEAQRFLAMMTFANVENLAGYVDLLSGGGCEVQVAEDTGRFPSHVDLYLNMIDAGFL